MNTVEWIDRYKHRMDISTRVTHLTKGENEEDAFFNLLSILKDKEIHGSTTESGFICGKIPAVCFQETPLCSIAENLQYEEYIRKKNFSKIRYLGFGIRFSKRFIYRKGGRPVIYDDTDSVKDILPKDEYWRIVNLNLSNNNIIDWTHEREWRIPQKLIFNYSNCEIIVPSAKYYRRFIKYCFINKEKEMLSKIRGIIVLNSVCY